MLRKVAVWQVKVELSCCRIAIASLGDTFNIIAATEVQGTFDVELLPTLAGALKLLVDYQPTSVSLLVGLAGDFDFDGDVDGFDLLKWQRGESPMPLSQSDLNDWKTNYGMIAPLVAATATVPEPNSLALLCLGGLLVLQSIRKTAAFTG